jgi:hypothetical protein
MRFTHLLREGARLAALVGAIAIVVWTMPEHPQAAVPERGEQVAANH